MKIQNNIIIFEEIECWNCKGKKEVEQGVWCQLNHRPVNKFSNKRCPHCNAKSKNDHKIVGKEIVPCYYCEQNGTKMEDKFDNLPQDLYYQLNFEVMKGVCVSGAMENLFGMGIVGGSTDYGEMFNFAAIHNSQEIIDKVKRDYNERQVIGFLSNPKNNDGKLCQKYGIFIGRNDWSVKPMI